MSISLVYAIPDPNRSDAEARKRGHQDLRRLSDFGLLRELHRLEDVLAWSLDICSLHEAKSKGATQVVLQEKETKGAYSASNDLIRTKGFHVRLGHCRSLALALPHWRVTGNDMLTQFRLFSEPRG